MEKERLIYTSRSDNPCMVELRQDYHHNQGGTFSKGTWFIIDYPKEGKGGYLGRPANVKQAENLMDKLDGEEHIFIPGHLVEFVAAEFY